MKNLELGQVGLENGILVLRLLEETLGLGLFLLAADQTTVEFLNEVG